MSTKLTMKSGSIHFLNEWESDIISKLRDVAAFQLANRFSDAEQALATIREALQAVENIEADATESVFFKK